mmetsp:Transcript_28571/g.58404  ORF Transcript_28571/g.58404 Transcript_28571/m.58404 type:complete len:556 (+) Transcript_28571:130-1797(+)
MPSTKVSSNLVCFFDCDDCLYFNNWGTAKLLTAKIEHYCRDHLSLPEGKAYELYKKHGTCLRGLLEEGLIADSGVDAFLEAVHDIPLHDIHPSPELRALLLRTPFPRWVFTASVASHAKRCLQRLGIDDLFLGIIDCKACNLATKHSPSAFADAMRVAGVGEGEGGRCVFFDDSVKNLHTAKVDMGWNTVLVGLYGRDDGQRIVCGEADYEVDSILDIEKELPFLFNPKPNSSSSVTVHSGNKALSAALPMLPPRPPPAFTLLYFPLMARGLGPALVAEYSGLPWAGPLSVGFDAKRDWPVLKASSATPFGQLPIMTLHGGDEEEVVVAQTAAIVNCIARMASNEDGDSLEGAPGAPFATSQMLLGEAEELYALLQRHVPTIFAELGTNGKGDLEGYEAFYDEVLPRHLRRLEAMLKKRSPTSTSNVLSPSWRGKRLSLSSSLPRLTSQPATTALSPPRSPTLPSLAPPPPLAGELYLFSMLHQAISIRRPACLAPPPTPPQAAATEQPPSVVSAAAYCPLVRTWYIALLSQPATQAVLRGDSAFGPLNPYFIAP